MLIDALTLCVPLLARLGMAADRFYGEHKADADGLVKEKRTEVEHVVAAKRAKARMLLQRLENQLEPDEFEEVVSSPQGGAEFDVDLTTSAAREGGNMYAIAQDCPESGSKRRLCR